MAEPQIVSLKPRVADTQTQLYYKDGSPIAPDDTAAAVARGEAYSTGDTVRVNVGDTPGAAVPTHGLANFLAQRGASVETTKQAKTRELTKGAESIPGMVGAGAEGLVRGASMGFVEPAMMYGSEGREAALLRQQLNPKIAGGSEFAGAIGAAIAASALTGGAGAPEAAGGAGARISALLARGALTPFRAAAALGEAAEGAAGLVGAGEGILGAGLKMGARGAAEGALYGAGHEVSQAALEDVPLTAERLLAGAWDGAKVGGAFGLGLGVLSKGVGKAGRAIVGRMTESGDDLGKATGTWAEGAMFKQQVSNQGKMYDRATKFGADPQGPYRIGRKLLDADISTNSKVALQQVDALRAGAAERMKAVVQAVDDAGVVTNPGNILRQVDDQIAKIREVPFGDAQAVADRIERNIAPFRERFTAKVVPGEPAAVPFGAEGYGAAPAANLTTIEPPPVKLSDLWRFRQQLDESINHEVAQRGPAKEALRDMRSAFVAELDDTIARAAETSGMDPGLLKAWKGAAEDYGDMALIKDGLKGLIKQRAKNRAVSPSDYAAGALMGILTGNPVTGMATSAIAGGVHKLIRERGLGVMAKIADRTGGVASQMELAGKVAAMVETPKRLATPAAVNVSQLFERYSQALTTAQADPAKFAERMASATADLTLRTPELAQQIQQTMLGDLAYLDQLHPKPSSQKAATLTPMAVKTEYYSFDQRKTFVDAAMALDNPMGIFSDIARGELPLAGVNALKVRRPLLFGEMQRTVIKYTAQRQEELPFSRRMLLGVAFDFKSDWSMSNVDKIQESLAMGTEAPGGGAPSPNDPRAAPSKVGTDPGANIQPGIF